MWEVARWLGRALSLCGAVTFVVAGCGGDVAGDEASPDRQGGEVAAEGGSGGAPGTATGGAGGNAEQAGAGGADGTPSGGGTGGAGDPPPTEPACPVEQPEACTPCDEGSHCLYEYSPTYDGAPARCTREFECSDGLWGWTHDCERLPPCPATRHGPATTCEVEALACEYPHGFTTCYTLNPHGPDTGEPFYADSTGCLDTWVCSGGSWEISAGGCTT